VTARNTFVVRTQAFTGKLATLYLDGAITEDQYWGLAEAAKAMLDAADASVRLDVRQEAEKAGEAP
jgi:hypothetical protein